MRSPSRWVQARHNTVAQHASTSLVESLLLWSESVVNSQEAKPASQSQWNHHRWQVVGLMSIKDVLKPRTATAEVFGEDDIARSH